MKTLGIIVAVVCIVLFVAIAVTGFYALWDKTAEKKKLKKKKSSGSVPKPPPMKLKKGIYDDYCD